MTTPNSRGGRSDAEQKRRNRKPGIRLTEAERKAFSDLIAAGNAASNLAFNISQHSGMPNSWDKNCKEASRRWDDALRNSETLRSKIYRAK